MSFFKNGGVTRRRFLAGSAAATAAAAAVMSLSACSDNTDRVDGEPQIVDDESQIVNVFDDYKSVDGNFQATSSWSLPLGTLLWHTDGSWAAAMMTPESAVSPNSIGVLSLASGDLITLEGTATHGRTYSFYDVRCGSGVFVWVEIEYSSLDWVLLAAGMSEGALTGDPVQIDKGNADWDPPMFTAVGSTVYWQKMPNASGSKSAEASHCYRWSVGDNDHTTVWESLGRFATQPRVCNNVLTISPRVRADEGTYYGMTAVDLSDSNFRQLDQLVLPAGVRPFEAVYMGDTFAFAIEASYNGAGSLGNMGTFVGREGGPYIYVSREPAACPAGKNGQYIVKTRASYYVVNTQEETYAVLSCPDRSLDYGEYPASEGTCDQFLTYATVKNEQGIPAGVTARVFSL